MYFITRFALGFKLPLQFILCTADYFTYNNQKFRRGFTGLLLNKGCFHTHTMIIKVCNVLEYAADSIKGS